MYAGVLIALQIINNVGAYQNCDKDLLDRIMELLKEVCDRDPSLVRACENQSGLYLEISLICTSRCILSFDNMMHVAMEGMMLLTLTTCCFEE